MRPMKGSHFSIALLLASLDACSGAAQPSVCGESFCLPEGAKLISRETPVEDFNLYRVQDAGKRFLIYEGNHPQRGKGSIVLTVGKQWPYYLEVSGPCASQQDCAVRTFAAKLTIR
jgi:hypothetical protein